MLPAQLPNSKHQIVYFYQSKRKCLLCQLSLFYFVLMQGIPIYVIFEDPNFLQSFPISTNDISFVITSEELSSNHQNKFFKSKLQISLKGRSKTFLMKRNRCFKKEEKAIQIYILFCYTYISLVELLSIFLLTDQVFCSSLQKIKHKLIS